MNRRDFFAALGGMAAASVGVGLIAKAAPARVVDTATGNKQRVQ
jgi:hypothetical protein